MEFTLHLTPEAAVKLARLGETQDRSTAQLIRRAVRFHAANAPLEGAASPWGSLTHLTTARLTSDLADTVRVRCAGPERPSRATVVRAAVATYLAQFEER